MRGHVAISRRSGVAADFLDNLAAAGRSAFPLDQLINETGLSMIAAKRQLSRIGSRVVQVSRRHSFFLIVAPEHRAVGAPPVAWWLDDFFKWLGRPYYLALQSAAATYGSTPQALQVTQVITSEPRRPIVVGRLRIQFFVKRRIDRTPTQSLANAYAPLMVSSPEATSFDLIRYAARIGGLGRAVETLVPMVPLLRVAEMKRVLEAENEASTAQRLGYILERSGNTELAAAIHDWLPARLPLIPIVPTKAKSANSPVIEKWRLVNNGGESEL